MMEYSSGMATRTNVNGSLSRRLSRPMCGFISFRFVSFFFGLVSFYEGTVKAELCNATQGSRDCLDRAASILHSGRSFVFRSPSPIFLLDLPVYNRYLSSQFLRI